MIRRTSILSAAVLAVAGLAGSASAATITPNPTSFTLTGALTLKQTTTVTCNVTLNGVVPAGGGSATITGGSFAPGSWPCGLLVKPTGFPWPVSLNGGTSITVAGVSATTIIGNCGGNITLNWTNGPPSKAVLSGVSIPGSPSPCTISGSLFSTPTLTIN